MANVTYNTSVIARELADKLKIRLSALAFVEGLDTDGNPTIKIGSGSTGTASAFIKVVPITWAVATDSLGNTAIQYGPHVIQLATEANYAATTDNVADNLTRAQLLPLLGEILFRGTQVEWYEEAYGTGPSVTTITGSKLKASFAPLYWPMQSA